MKTRLAVTAVVATIALTAQMFLALSALADDKKTAHSLFFTESVPPDTPLVCGLVKPDKPYTLHVSGVASGSPGTFSIIFRDGDAMGFSVPADSSYSTTQALGGVPNVDSPSVMITQTGGVSSMMASVLAADGGKAFCTHCTGGVTGGTTGHASDGSGSPPNSTTTDFPVCNFP